MPRTKPKTSADLEQELREAQKALAEAREAVEARRAEYQAALKAEALGEASPGTARTARYEVTEAQDAVELAQARVDALQEALSEARRQEALEECRELAQEYRVLLQELEAAQEAVLQELDAVADKLGEWRALQERANEVVRRHNAAAAVAGVKALAPVRRTFRFRWNSLEALERQAQGGARRPERPYARFT